MSLTLDVVSANVASKNRAFLPFLIGEMLVTAPWTLTLVQGSSISFS